jgi:BirA family transcriptional regulator, biotin operon repressor / biotin---[acetyl-CoA-carboxylase] ligase
MSGAELAEQAGVSRAAVWARIEELRRLGYEIQANPHQGYRLVSTPDALHADDLLARLTGTRVIGRDVRVFRETNSTNDVVEKLARDGVREGVVVYAESQSKGRGRMGRKWISPPQKGLWFSVLLRPQMRPQAVTQIIVAAAAALSRSIRRVSGVAVQIKWPNDILIEGRKVAGILTELNAEVDRVKYVILGIGVDVNLVDDDLPEELKSVATSVRIASGQKVDRPALAAAILEELDLDYDRLNRGEFKAVAEEWETQCVTLGHDVAITVGDREIRGRAESLDDDGALMVRSAHGTLERIIGGDVILEK